MQPVPVLILDLAAGDDLDLFAGQGLGALERREPPVDAKQRRRVVGKKDVGAVSFVEFGQPGIQTRFYGHIRHDRSIGVMPDATAAPTRPQHDARPALGGFSSVSYNAQLVVVNWR